MDFKAISEKIKAGAIIRVKGNNTNLLLCGADHENAIAKLKSVMHIAAADGVNVWVDNDGRLERHVNEIPEVAWQLIDSTDGKITLMIPDGKLVAKNALFAQGEIALTLTEFQWAKKLIQMSKTALAVFPENGLQDADLLKEVDVVNLPSENDNVTREIFPIIKVAADGGIKIVRREGIDTLKHI